MTLVKQRMASLTSQLKTANENQANRELNRELQQELERSLEEKDSLLLEQEK